MRQHGTICTEVVQFYINNQTEQTEPSNSLIFAFLGQDTDFGLMKRLQRLTHHLGPIMITALAPVVHGVCPCTLYSGVSHLYKGFA